MEIILRMQNAVIFTLLLICFIVLWVFYNFKPEYGSKRAIGAFNACILFVASLLVGAWSFKIYAILHASPKHEALWPYIASGGSLIIWVSTFTIGFCLRNFWIFRPSRRPTNNVF